MGCSRTTKIRTITTRSAAIRSSKSSPAETPAIRSKTWPVSPRCRGLSRRWAVGFAVSIADLNRLRELFVTLFIQSFDASLGSQPPQRITLDLDAWDDETHGQQQLSLFHVYYDQHQYYPLAITCAENDQLVMVSLRHGTATAFLGADDDLLDRKSVV